MDPLNEAVGEEYPHPPLMPQVDYRTSPSFGGDIPEGHYDRDHPVVAPEYFVSPGIDEEIVNYDLPHEPHTYNQMSLGLPAQVKGWSQDSYAATNPDVNPRGRR